MNARPMSNRIDAGILVLERGRCDLREQNGLAGAALADDRGVAVVFPGPWNASRTGTPAIAVAEHKRGPVPFVVGRFAARDAGQRRETNGLSENAGTSRGCGSLPGSLRGSRSPR